MRIKKMLIANRGEIARRIIRTCNKMGIRSVAVYSETDADLPFVKEVGPPHADKSYLNVDRIIQAAKETQAEAVHPGFGFLSENAGFAQRCSEEDLLFIGPRPEHLEWMGSKVEARRRMKEAGVPVVPGQEKSLESVEEALSVAKIIGYPVMLKASAGGGGIGMQGIRTSEELKKAFASTRQRASSYFGDGTVFMEKWIEKPRHIEVQVASDHKGHVVHFFERECSVQRRNQKVIEESPSPFLNPATRQKLLDAALRGVRHIGYRNVGTMEFIFDKDGHFYFLEMNTRLQVEYPVTEETVGVDLVEWQIRLALGEDLPEQGEIRQWGHAVECRIYAEDPQNFLPSPGRIDKLTLPKKGARLDRGFEEGNRVPPFYDPMIGKTITYGNDREEAIHKMKTALSETKIEGIKTNLSLLSDALDSPEFKSGRYTTRLLDGMTNPVGGK